MIDDNESLPPHLRHLMANETLHAEVRAFARQILAMLRIVGTFRKGFAYQENWTTWYQWFLSTLVGVGYTTN